MVELAGLLASVRPEELSVDQWISLYNQL
jgi:hypothetical protein